MIKAVIFDMDGLMVDSEPIHQQAFDQVFQKYGKHFTAEDNIRLYLGKTDMDCAYDMVTRYHLPITAEELFDQKQVITRQLLSKISPRPGLMDLLNNLKRAGMKMAIASSSELVTIKIIVNALDVNDFFDALFSAEHVKNSKPAPDVYLLAAKEIGVDPDDCLILEDSPIGVQSAVSAGMKVYAIPGEETKNGDFTRATKRLNNLSEVFEELKEQV